MNWRTYADRSDLWLKEHDRINWPGLICLLGAGRFVVVGAWVDVAALCLGMIALLARDWLKSPTDRALGDLRKELQQLQSRVNALSLSSGVRSLGGAGNG